MSTCTGVFRVHSSSSKNREIATQWHRIVACNRLQAGLFSNQHCYLCYRCILENINSLMTVINHETVMTSLFDRNDASSYFLVHCRLLSTDRCRTSLTSGQFNELWLISCINCIAACAYRDACMSTHRWLGRSHLLRCFIQDFFRFAWLVCVFQTGPDANTVRTLNG